MKPSVMLFFTILGIFATFLLCAGASLVGVTMSHARPYPYGGWDNTRTPKTAVVLVAREDIPAGTRITKPETAFRVRIYRIGEEPRDALADFDPLREKILRRTLRRGEICTLAHLQTANDEVLLPDGKKAFSFRTILDPAIAGVIAPGTRVDVSGQAPIDQFGQGAFKVLAQDCIVLAVNELPSAPDEVRGPMPVPAGQANWLTRTLTIAVSPQEAIALTGAKNQAQLSVTLRAPKD